MSKDEILRTTVEAFKEEIDGSEYIESCYVVHLLSKKYDLHIKYDNEYIRVSDVIR